ncbi:MAG: glycosyltransferase, partial [Bacteroidota bacterium]
EEFPDLPMHQLPAYDVQYDHDNMIRAMAGQLPRIARAIQQENKATQHLINRYHFRGIISDNRYGVRSKHVPSVIICHQVNIRVPNSVLQSVVRIGHRRSLAAFDAIWVPDFADAPGLSGELGHDLKLKNVQYLGPLSRFSSGGSKGKETRKILAILSGPEPQRGYLEKLITKQLLDLPVTALIVCGNTHENKVENLNERVKRISYLTADALQQAIQESEFIICRSGYSSLMDLYALGKKALLIPTPGQTEQAYLAKIFGEKPGYIYQDQVDCHLPKGITALEKENDPKQPNTSQWQQQQERILHDWLASLFVI